MLAEKVDNIVSHPIAFEQVRDKISLFGGLSDRQLDLMLPYLKFASFSKGHYVFKQGQLPSSVFIVLSGEVNLQVRRDDGSYATMSYSAGDCFGETSLIGIQPQLGSALVVADTEVVVLSRSCLLDVVAYDQEMFGILMMNIAREVSRRFHSCLSLPEGSKGSPIAQS